MTDTNDPFYKLVKDTYLSCDNKHPDGLYPDEVDLLEFSRKLLERREKFFDAYFKLNPDFDRRKKTAAQGRVVPSPGSPQVMAEQQLAPRRDGS